MSSDTSIGPDDASPQKGDAADRAITEGVDAHAESEFDLRHSLGGSETKPVSNDGKSEPADKKVEKPTHGLVDRPSGAFPPAGQQGAGADRN